MSVILKAHMGVDVLLEFEGDNSSKVVMVPEMALGEGIQ